MINVHSARSDFAKGLGYWHQTVSNISIINVVPGISTLHNHTFAYGRRRQNSLAAFTPSDWYTHNSVPVYLVRRTFQYRSFGSRREFNGFFFGTEYNLNEFVFDAKPDT